MTLKSERNGLQKSARSAKKDQQEAALNFQEK